MSVDPPALLFFDASCLIAASASPRGGSAVLAERCRRGWLRGAMSHAVLLEAERNIAVKLGVQAANRYHRLLARTPWRLASLPSASGSTDWGHAVNPKDHHVIVACLAVSADYLITLDQRLLVELQRITLPFEAMTPGTFIRTILPLLSP